MNFFTNRIANPASNGITFEEYIQKILKKASEAKPECDGDPRGQCRGQVINNDNEEGAHSYQEGESVDGKKEQGGNARADKGGKTDQSDNKQKDKEAAVKGVFAKAAARAAAKATKEAKCGKEMGESSDAGKVTEKHTEAGPGDDEHPEPKILINNDPNYQKGESTDPSKIKGKKKQPGEPVVSGKGSKASVSEFAKVSSLSRKDKLELFSSLSADANNPIEYVEAAVGLKVANMTSDEKAWFKKFWEVLFPPEYVSEMLADR